MGIDYKALALECGFNSVGDLDPSTIVVTEDVRSMCAADRCDKYGKSWSCPPACGDLEYWRGEIAKYKKGYILQYVGDREDSYDWEAMMEAADECKKAYLKYVKALNKEGLDYLFMSAGTCTVCEKCSYPDEPCRFPELMKPSMEACGIVVSKTCVDNDHPYNYGDEKIAYTCCILFNE